MIDDKLIEGIMDEELYMFASFYPAPIDSLLRGELTDRNIELTRENISRINYKDNTYYLDNDIKLLYIQSEPIESINGMMGSNFIRSKDL